MSERQVSISAPTSMGRQAAARVLAMLLAAIVVCGMLAAPAAAQQEPYYSPEQMNHLVSRVALYPDPLLAQVLAAATFPDEIPEAARWADEHRNINGERLADQINYDQLPWDPSVQALLPFPNVLDAMASDMDWTNDLGNAFLSNQTEVMYAVQRMRQRARDYGYLRTGPQMVVSSGPYITIMPARPDYVVVPTYDPVVVYERPRPGFFVGAAIGFRFGVALGVAYRPWGWGYNRISWNERVVIVNNSPWHRTWVNRTVYVHPYTVRRVVVHDRGWMDRHEAMERERDHWREREHREAVRHEERREEHREAERREEHRDRERHEAEERRERDRHEAEERRAREARFAHERDERREAERREHERREEHRDARRDDRHDDHRAVQEAHHDNQQVRREEHHPAQEAHRDNVRVDQHPAQEAHRDNARVDQHPAQEAHRDNTQVKRVDQKDDHQRGKSDDHRNDNHDKDRKRGDGGEGRGR
jgi:hypothetical protein